MKKLLLTFAVLVLLLGVVTTALAQSTRCGDGSAPDYGFTHSRDQEHWTRGWETYLSGKTVTEIDKVLDGLYNGNIVETVVLFMPASSVGNRVNCAVHYLRYMEMGRPSGPRQDNGYALLFVVEPDGSLDVHYGVGLGLPSMTAPHLTEINRMAEQAYDATKSYDDAVLIAVNELDTYARSLYEPISDSEYEKLISPEERSESAVQEQSQENQGMSPGAWLVVLVLVFLVLLVVLAIFLGGNSGGTYSSPGPSRSSPSTRTGSSSPTRSSPSRSGRGGGRSGRGN
ncbi:hypothetical protein C4561_01160 [candidate division WWE3 bacterium]|jgi:hypothetical protein|uniref:TPM domain-containing protein n=1 Tax=candidate division WWE3 bacterium TaxID=2053526 RepID=A0A3A4ZLV8_UNCKA|nr:MAG: hypothetical protein C4561_01160 [candidate division WWE3 bacterium]